jgi:hypothetical protein
MNDSDQKILGLLGGGLTTAAVHYVRTQDNLERRIDRTDDRARDAQDGLNSWLNSGTVARLIKQTVQDVLGGIAAASPAPQTPTAVPTTTNIARPDISGVSTATETNWPPVAGIYNEQANIVQVGELARFGLALTYQEVRTALLALVQATPPTLGGKVQIYNALNALVQSVASRALTWNQYKAVWDALFQNGAVLTDAHRDPLRLPSVSSFGNQVASVALLPGSTDEVCRFRVTAAAGPGVVTGTNLFSLSFASEYRAVLGGTSQPIAPLVLAERLPAHELVPVSVSASGYSVLLTSGSIAGGSSLDFKVLAAPGLAPG